MLTGKKYEVDRFVETSYKRPAGLGILQTVKGKLATFCCS